MANKIFTIYYSPSDSKVRLKSELVCENRTQALELAKKQFKNRGYKKIVVSKNGKSI